jgi:hypothetical protein
MVKRASWLSITPKPWLSITPEPERELPEAVATLSYDGVPPVGAVARERERVEQLVLHGSVRAWLAYLHEVVELIDRSEASADQGDLPDAGQSASVARARARARAVISNHHNLLLALPGRAAEWTAADRARLAASFASPAESTEPIESTQSTEPTEQRKP